jgi:hypothetical protein
LGVVGTNENRYAEIVWCGAHWSFIRECMLLSLFHVFPETLVITGTSSCSHNTTTMAAEHKSYWKRQTKQ